MAQSFGDPLRPLSGDVGDPAETGGLAALFCRVARERVTGVAYVERPSGAAVLSFRDGRGVFFEDLGDDAQSIPDVLLERGLLTPQQYSAIGSQVLESLAENEDLAFCQLAVQQQVLTQAQLETELARWLRGRFIQAISWEDCRVELDADPDALTGILECPMDLGPLVYMGVRTFYDDARIGRVLRDRSALYVRLTVALPDVIELFGLDDEEIALFARLRPDAELERAIEEHSADPVEVLQLLCMFRFAGFVELAGTPLGPIERSGVRTTESMTSGAARELQMPADMAAKPAARPPSQARIQAALDGQRAPTRPEIPVTTVGRSASDPRVPVARPQDAVSRRLATSYSSGKLHAIRDEQVTRNPSVQRTGPSNTPSAPPAQARGHREPQPVVPAHAPIPATPAAAPVMPLRERPKPRKLSSTLKRLDRDLRQLRQQTPARVEPPSAPVEAPSTGHVEQLVRMRQQTMSMQNKTQADSTAARNGSELFRSALDAMREQQFARAYEVMRKACSAEPNNDVFTMYCMWASFRAGSLREEGVTKLRAILREKISDHDQKAFAYYALGHLSLAEKKEEAAEKFFRKAVELDRNNKDAERHLRIIELRRKSATEHEKSGKLFGIEIKPRKS